MSEVGRWLKGIGLDQYADAFDKNEIDMALLAQVDDQLLKDLGVLIAGHRLRLRNAIAQLGAPPPAETTRAQTAAAKPEPPSSAERRQLTVMFVDLVGSTALSARLDPEDMRDIIGTYHRCCAEEIAKAGGVVAKYMGDGALAYFGYPEAHEDDAERAVRSALALVEAVARLRVGFDAALQVRIGIATGLVVVGDLVGEGDSRERGVVGDTPNLAARLQGIAEPGVVVIADGTRRLIGGLFVLADLGPKDLKGVSPPARAWAVLRRSAVESRFDALRAGGLSVLVGREEEFEAVCGLWERAKTGAGQAVLLSGEAGIGKSRLAAALSERLADQPYARLRYFCSPERADSALYPIVGQMERAAGLARDDDLKVKLDKLDAVLALTSTPNEDAALFAEMLSLPNDGRYRALELAPQKRRQRTLEALMVQVSALARTQPVLMIFEDVHWADPTSIEALGLLFGRLQGLRALLLTTFRPEFDAPWTGRHVTRLALNRIGKQDAAAIVASLTLGKALPQDVMDEIVDRTDGVPLFVEEMTKAVLEAEGDRAARRTIAATPSSAAPVPPSLHASLMARLDRLGSAKEVAQIGAAIGREFSYELLASVAQKSAADLDSALDRFIDAGLLVRRGEPSDAVFVFKHALVRDAAYGTLLRGPRQELHARIAAALERDYPDVAEIEPEVLARHCAEAGLLADAIERYLAAAKRATARSNNVEASRHIARGLELLGKLPSGSPRAAELHRRLMMGGWWWSA
jgi:class 3 adenylate cyclase